jgi:hypothetical protein
MAVRELDSAGLDPIAQARSLPPIEEATTGADGRYTLESLGPGPYGFVVAAPGFEEHVETEHRLVCGANPVCFDTEDGEGVMTDAPGYFRFDTLRDAKHMLLAFQDDYESLQKKDVRPDEEPLTLRLGPGAGLYGTIVDAASGRPLAAAPSSVTDFAHLRKTCLETFSDLFALASGEREELGQLVLALSGEISGVAAGAEDRLVHGVSIEARREGGTELTPGASVRSEGGGVLEGTVVSSSGKPVQGAEVLVRDFADGIEQHRAVSDRAGRFGFAAIAAQDFVEARASCEGFATFREEKVPVGTTDHRLVSNELEPIVSNEATRIDSSEAVSLSGQRNPRWNVPYTPR